MNHFWSIFGFEHYLILIFLSKRGFCKRLVSFTWLSKKRWQRNWKSTFRFRKICCDMCKTMKIREFFYCFSWLPQSDSLISFLSLKFNCSSWLSSQSRWISVYVYLSSKCYLNGGFTFDVMFSTNTSLQVYFCLKIMNVSHCLDKRTQKQEGMKVVF